MKLKLEEPFKSKWKKAYLRESKEDGRSMRVVLCLMLKFNKEV